MSGTSMATPNVAGVLVRYRAAHPTATVAQVRDAVRATARDMEARGFDNNTGYGLIDPVRLLTGVKPATVPSAARLRAVTYGNSSARVWFAPPLSNGGAVLTGYVVRAYRGATVVKTATARAGTTSVMVSGLRNGAAYTFTVAGVNTVGAGPSSARSAAVVPRTRPGAPRIGVPSAGRRSATARWAAPGTDGGAAVTSYLVRAYRGSVLVKTVAVRAGATRVVVHGLGRRVGYRFTVTAVNAVGAGTVSARSATVHPR
jgi:hypothetical protein